MTSLIDVIFLLLLFFMLSSTFSKFSELELSAGGTGGTGSGAATNTAPLFLELSEDALRLNGANLSLATLAQAINSSRQGQVQPLLVSLKSGATSQRLTDLLIALRPIQGLSLTVLGSGD